VIERIQKFSEPTQTGQVKIKVYNKIVDLKHPEVMQEIRENNPYTMSWSNMCDYYHPKTFFAIAN
jgi:hypothetical protein